MSPISCRGTLPASPLGHLTRGKVSPEARVTRRVSREAYPALRAGYPPCHPDAPMYMPSSWYTPGYTLYTPGYTPVHRSNDPSSGPPAAPLQHDHPDSSAGRWACCRGAKVSPEARVSLRSRRISIRNPSANNLYNCGGQLPAILLLSALSRAERRRCRKGLDTRLCRKPKGHHSWAWARMAHPIQRPSQPPERRAERRSAQEWPGFTDV